MLLLIALVVGGLIPIQTAANSRLRLSVGNHPVVSALISFSVALLVAIVATTILRGNPLPHFAPGTSAPWWVWLGGLMGVCFVLGNIVLFPRLGAVQTVVLPILGQVVMGLVIDRFGRFNAPRLDVSVPRILGALVVLVGIVVTLRADASAKAEGDAHGLELWAYRALGVLVGVGSAVQTAVNGYLGTIAGSSLHAGEINLAVGSLLLLIAALATSPGQFTRRPAAGHGDDRHRLQCGHDRGGPGARGARGIRGAQEPAHGDAPRRARGGVPRRARGAVAVTRTRTSTSTTTRANRGINQALRVA